MPYVLPPLKEALDYDPFLIWPYPSSSNRFKKSFSLHIIPCGKILWKRNIPWSILAKTNDSGLWKKLSPNLKQACLILNRLSNIKILISSTTFELMITPSLSLSLEILPIPSLWKTCYCMMVTGMSFCSLRSYPKIFVKLLLILTSLFPMRRIGYSGNRILKVLLPLSLLGILFEVLFLHELG